MSLTILLVKSLVLEEATDTLSSDSHTIEAHLSV